MSEKSGFFNGKLMIEGNGLPMLHEDGSYMYDREYDAAEFAGLFALFLGNGIRNGGTNLKVSASGEGLTVMVHKGEAMINGYFYKLTEEPLYFTLPKPEMPNRQIFTVVVRLDLRQEEGRRIYADILPSEQGLNPAAQKLTRNSEIYELALADILVNATTNTVTDANITDLRLDNEFCGLINSLITVETEEILSQIDGYFKEQQEIWEKRNGEFQQWVQAAKGEFESWYSEIKAELWQNVYADFDNWIYKDGYSYVIEKQADKSIKETLKNTISGNVLAQRQIRAVEKGVEEQLIFYEPEIGMKKTTVMDSEGTVISKVEVIS